MSIETVQAERARLADEIGIMPEELDEDIRLARVTADLYRYGAVSLGPILFCALEYDGSIGVWHHEDGAPDGLCLANGDTVTEALWSLLDRAALAPAPAAQQEGE